MPNKIAKSYAISDAKIQFVSLVDKAANKHQFLITKSADGTAGIQSFGRIVKVDSDTHYVTGIVYEPMAEDTDGNYMTEEEITKAAHWFMKNAGAADIQHCFEKAENVEVVESFVTKCDMEMEGQAIKKGTWLMTMEVADDDVWQSIEKGDITGFSMGGTGKYSTQDVDISATETAVEKDGAPKGLFKRFAKALGFDVIEKGAMKENYKKRVKEDNFYSAWYSLRSTLEGYNYNNDTGCLEWDYSGDEETIREALTDFNEIVTEILAGDNVVKAIEKAGKKMSTANQETLKGIHESLGAFLSTFDEQEEEEVTKSEIESIVTDAIQKALKPDTVQAANSGSGTNGEVTKGDNAGNAADGGNVAQEGITADEITKMVNDAIQKAVQPSKEEPVTKEQIEGLIADAVTKAMEPVLKSAGLPTNLDNGNVKKGAGEECYLHGLL